MKSWCLCRQFIKEMEIFKISKIIFLAIIILKCNAIGQTSGISKEAYLSRPAVISDIFQHLEKGLDFMDKYHSQINLDGVLGLIIAESEVMKVINRYQLNSELEWKLKELVEKCARISKKIIPGLPNSPRKYVLLKKILLRPEFWESNSNFKHNLPDVGLYDWTKEDLLANKEAVYRGLHSDVCVEELLQNSINQSLLGVSRKCEEMMFGNRVDHGYLQSHRLFYLQIGIRSGYFETTTLANLLIKTYCTLMLKEAKTNDKLKFPQHDIFLEQLVLCGIEGMADFMSYPWLQTVLSWQTPEGCYSNGTSQELRYRSTNVIQFGCTDHTTGLGIAALVLHLHYNLQNN